MASERVTELFGITEMEPTGFRVTEAFGVVEMGPLGMHASELFGIVEMEPTPGDVYAIAHGHNMAISYLIPLVPQLTTPGLLVTRRTHSPNNRRRDKFLYTYHLYSALGSVAEYQAVLAQYGVLTQLENEVTVTAYDDTYGWQRYNATAVQPEQGVDVQHRMPFPRTIQVLLKYMELAQ